jgi:hypothetical protein
LPGGPWTFARSSQWVGPVVDETEEIPMTSQHAFFIISGIIFGLVALFHALRLASHWHVRINQREIPMWVSMGVLVVAAGLCFWAFWLLF